MSLKPYPDYRDSGVAWLGEVPSSWEIHGIKLAASTSGGSGFPHEFQGIEDAAVPFHKVSALAAADSDGVIRTKQDTVSPATAHKLRATVFPAGSIVMAKIGAALLLGRIRTVDRPFCIDNNMLAVTPKNHTNNRFLYYALQTIDFNLIVNPGTVPSLDMTAFRDYPLAFPSGLEQSNIAAYLDRETAEIDAFIAEQEELITLLGERRTATITQAVTKGLDPEAPMKDSGIEWVGKIPKHWNLRRLWTLFDREKNVGYPDEQMLSVFRDHGVVQKGSMANLNKTAENRNIYQLVGPGWLVSNRMKAWQGSVGISTYRGIVSGHYICFRPKHTEHSPYLNYLFRSRAYTAGYSSISRGVRIGQAEIDNDEYRLLPVLLPPLTEQRKIAEYLKHETTEISAAIADAKEAIALSKERRAAMISAVVTGKIDVRGVPAPALTGRMEAESVGVA